MSYRLGIDVGSACTSATIVRDGELRVFQIDGRSAAVSSASLAYDVWSEIDLAMTPDTAAASIAEVVERVRRAEAADAEAIAVAYPPTWSQQESPTCAPPCRSTACRGSACSAPPGPPRPPPRTCDRIHDGEVVAVFDIGPRMSTVSVLRMVGSSRFAALAAVGTVELSGRQVDAAVYEHLMNCLDAIAGDDDRRAVGPGEPCLGRRAALARPRVLGGQGSTRATVGDLDRGRCPRHHHPSAHHP